jgi:predicted GNAT family N-acyltransferase
MTSAVLLMAIDLEILPVDAEQVIDLRHAVLRGGLPRESARFEGDKQASTVHFGAFENQRLVGCATMMQRQWQSEPAWQVRGMAVVPDRRRCGVGTRLLEAIDSAAIASRITRLWCNARTPAVPFYQEHGWRVVSDEFVIDTAGPHFKMTKEVG